ncbi:MAG TPA: LLM class flavin-dependent oxidoreductase [Mycobacterium sp.]|nr:LLM class flavin-dependent oxidoreductase [Mycobacterium sp.]
MIRIGLMFPPFHDPVDAGPLARQAEAAGFDFFACGEHVFFHGPVPNAFITLAAAAATTERIRLLSALTVLPMYPVALAAKLITTLDRVSGGRFDLGVGVGGEYPPEFEAVGIPVAQRGKRTDEALELLERLYTGNPVSFDGQFTTLTGQQLNPRPVQQPAPPVWIGGRRPAAMRRAARYGDVWLPYLVSPPQLAESLTRVRELAEELGRATSSVSGAVFCWSAVGRDATWARRTAIETVSSIYQQDFTRLADSYLVTGSPAQVTDRLAQFVDAGATSVVFAPACEKEQQPKVFDSFVTDVMPALRGRSQATVHG